MSIATPNNTHYGICRAALESGLHVICEKPLCFTIAEAEALRDLAVARNRVVGVTYGYAGHQLIEQAHRMIVAGELGEIRIVQMQFAHGFHSEAVEEANPSTRWRVDPKFAGPSYVLGDIGTHPLYLSEVMLPDLRIKRLLCSRQSFVKSRAPLEDNAFTIMEYDSGAIGYVWSSAVNAGSMHGQKIRVIGATASIEWWDERPNQFSYEIQGRPAQILERGMGYLYAAMPWPMTGSVPDIPRGCRAGPISTTALQWPWMRLTAATPGHCSRPSAIRIFTPVLKVFVGWRTVYAQRTKAACGSTTPDRRGHTFSGV